MEGGPPDGIALDVAAGGSAVGSGDGESSEYGDDLDEDPQFWKCRAAPAAAVSTAHTHNSSLVAPPTEGLSAESLFTPSVCCRDRGSTSGSGSEGQAHAHLSDGINLLQDAVAGETLTTPPTGGEGGVRSAAESRMSQDTALDEAEAMNTQWITPEAGNILMDTRIHACIRLGFDLRLGQVTVASGNVLQLGEHLDISLIGGDLRLCVRCFGKQIDLHDPLELNQTGSC